jgi:LmbE family N-acetylglucosaminyl deacetylase
MGGLYSSLITSQLWLLADTGSIIQLLLIGYAAKCYYGLMDTLAVFPPLKPNIVLGVAAHPDDLDFGASGTVARFASAGAQVYYLILTDGSKGSADETITSAALIKLRQAEQRVAAEALGIKEVFFLNYEDAALEVTQALKKDIVRYIRKLTPDVVITMDPSMLYDVARGFINHPDHRAAGQATVDAVYPLARDRLTFPDLLVSEGLQPHNVKTLLLNNFEKQNYYVDISETIEQKLSALAAHASQMPNLEATQDMMRQMATKAGRHVGGQYAEGFLRLDIAG